MKLKTFESFSGEEDLYKEISYDEWVEETDVEMSEKDERELDNICHRCGLTRSSWGGFSLDYEDVNDDWNYYNIRKADDEWFLVQYHEDYWYKCDSFVGVEKLLSDLRS